MHENITQFSFQVDSDNWLQFDARNQEFIGVPLENDVGREEYQLVCSDSEGYSAIDGIEVSTLSRPFYEKFNVLFVFVFNDTLDDGARLARSRVKLMSRIARIFRDSDTSQIVLNKVQTKLQFFLGLFCKPLLAIFSPLIAKVDAASFEVAWYNKTLSMRECPEEQIAAARSFLLTREGAVRQRVVQVGLNSLHKLLINVSIPGFRARVPPCRGPAGDARQLSRPSQPLPRHHRGPHPRPATSPGVPPRLRRAWLDHHLHAAPRHPHRLHPSPQEKGWQVGHV